MTPIIGSVIAILAVSAISLLGVFTLSLKQDFLRRILFLLISLAAGALLGDAFIHLIPEAFSEAHSLTVSLLVLAGILSFFALEKFLHWHHHHGEEEFSPEHARIHPVGKLVIISDAVHNFVDGLAIGIAFLVGPEVGIATAIAIALHEIPQEIGDFGLLVHAGFSRKEALIVNFVSALTAFVGLGAALLVAAVGASLIPLIAAFTAGNFIYIALADIVPELHKTKGAKKTLLQFGMIGVGIVSMVLLLQAS